MRVIYTSKGMSKKFWGARYTLGARYLSKNTVYQKYTGTAYNTTPVVRIIVLRQHGYYGLDELRFLSWMILFKLSPSCLQLHFMRCEVMNTSLIAI